MKKRIMAVILVIILCMQNLTYVMAEETAETMNTEQAVAQDTGAMNFKDVSSKDWYYNSVSYVFEKKIMTGLDAERFGGIETLCRAQFATVLYRMAGSVPISYWSQFPDIEEAVWYTSPVLWANENGIVHGYENKRFGPADNITREQIAVMLYRYAKFKGNDISARQDLGIFPDAGSVSGFATEAMQVWVLKHISR